MCAELSSISGSETETDESDDDDNDVGETGNDKSKEEDRDVQKLESLIRKTTVATSDESETKSRKRHRQHKTPVIWLPCASETGPVRVGVYRQALKETATTGEVSESDSDLKWRTLALERLSELSAEKASTTRGSGEARSWAVIMLGGGHFAGAIFDCLKGEPLVHKTFHRYTVRRKQGGGQSANDQSKGAAKSAGADLRRYNEQALRKDIQALLQTWNDRLKSCELIFVHAPSANRRVLFGEGEGVGRSLDPGDPRIRNLPFTTKRPTVNELKRSFVELSTIKVSRIDAASLAESEDRRRSVPESVKVRKTPEPGLTLPSLAEPVDEALEKLVELARKGKTQALVTHLEKHSLPPDVPIPSSLVDARNRTILHLAAYEGHAELVTRLLELGADPAAGLDGSETSETGPRRTAYEMSKDKEVRNAFRRAMASMPDRWNWGTAKVPSPLTKEMEEEQERKSKERKKNERQKKDASRKTKSARDGPSSPVEEMKDNAPANVRTKGVLSTLTRTELQASGLSPEIRARLDREKRARAAELRMANLSGPKATTGTCDFCRKDLNGITPFERLQFRYCSVPCVQEHRKGVP